MNTTNIETNSVHLLICDINREFKLEQLKEYERIIEEKGSMYLFCEDILQLLKITNYIDINTNFNFTSFMIWKNNKPTYILYYTFTPTHKELMDYSRRVKKEIGLSVGKINKRLGHRKAEHFFRDTQWCLPTKETYQELIDVFNIDTLSYFINYDKLVEILEDTRYTHNLDNEHNNILKEETREEVIERIKRTSISKKNKKNIIIF